jgi:choline dehydrogenase-like flavoprotein
LVNEDLFHFAPTPLAKLPLELYKLDILTPHSAMQRTIYDVCIVGSGPGGGICAYVLASAGLKVALVESGKWLRPGVDYGGHHDSIYQKLDERLAAKRSPLLGVTDFSDSNHFTPVGDRPGHGLLRAVGGRSLCWAGHSLRFGPLDFKRWPISYQEVAPYYSRAEHLMCVYGNKDGLWNMPDGEFQKGVPLRCGEHMLKTGVTRLKAQGRKMDFVPLRKAMPTEVHPQQRAKCHYCGHCMNGCEVDAKYTSANTPIPLALKTGNLTILTGCMMTRIVMETSRPRVAAIEYHNKAGAINQLNCRILVLACSTVETARHLLLNRTPDFPNGLANSSGQVGRNLTSHFGLSVDAFFPQLKNRDASNDDGTDYYNGLLSGLYWDEPSKHFDGTYQVQCGSGLHPHNTRLVYLPGFGSALKRKLKEKAICSANMNMQGALFTSAQKYVDLDPDRKDRFGLPLPRVHLHYEENDIAMAKDMVQTSEEIIRAAHGEVLHKPREVSAATLQIDYNHWVGTVKMGTDPKTSVLNVDGQAHDIANLFVGDSSVFSAYPEKNPTLTNIALAWRMSERLAGKARKGELA